MNSFAPFFKIDMSMILTIILIIAFVLMAIYQFYLTRKVRVQKENLQQLLAQRTAELESMNQELKDFAYLVAHDLKAPLRGISQLVDWLLEDYGNQFDQKGQEKLDLICNRVRRMDDLINGILQYSHAGVIDEEERMIDLNQLLTEVLDMIDIPEHIQVKVENQLPQVFISHTRIVQVFQNLLVNSVNYMDKKKGVIKIGCSTQGGFYKFWVMDNGPGVDPKYHDRIFQIFQTLVPRDEKESTGVGLTVVKRIVELYSGRIWLESETGKGCKFYFTLPKNGKNKADKKKK